MKTSDDYAPCVRIDANGNMRRGNVKEAMLLTPDKALQALREDGVVVVFVAREDAKAVLDAVRGTGTSGADG